MHPSVPSEPHRVLIVTATEAQGDMAAGRGGWGSREASRHPASQGFQVLPSCAHSEPRGHTGLPALKELHFKAPLSASPPSCHLLPPQSSATPAPPPAPLIGLSDPEMNEQVLSSLCCTRGAPEYSHLTLPHVGAPLRVPPFHPDPPSSTLPAR